MHLTPGGKGMHPSAAAHWSQAHVCSVPIAAAAGLPDVSTILHAPFCCCTLISGTCLQRSIAATAGLLFHRRQRPFAMSCARQQPSSLKLLPLQLCCHCRHNAAANSTAQGSAG